MILQEHFDERTSGEFLQNVPRCSKFLRARRAGSFKLYDTFGLPRDLSRTTFRDREVTFDSVGFERAMQEQRERARASWKGGAGKLTASPLPRAEQNDVEVIARLVA